MKKLLVFILTLAMCLTMITASTTYSATIKLNKTALTLNEGNTYTLKISGTTRTVKWSTSDKKIATVSSGGKVKAIKAGNTTISATVSSKKYNCKITVKDVLTNEEAAAEISYEAFELDDQLLLILNNANNVSLTSEVEVVYYDTNGDALSKENDYLWTFQAGKNAVVTFSYPHDDSYDRVDYDNYKVSITAELDSFMIQKSQIDNLSVESHKGSRYLIATVTNNSDEDLSSADITVLYYKNGVLIGYDDEYIFELVSGDDTIVEFLEPYDENYDKMEYDDYIIIINEAY